MPSPNKPQLAMPSDRTQAPPATHHYIPIFYSKRWASGDPPKLTRYARWLPGKIAIDRKVPSGVGWEKNGYSFDGFEGEQAEAVETDLMKPKDDKASKMLARLESAGADGPWADDDRFGWTWFVVSLLARGPQDVRSAKRNIEVEWAKPNDRMEARYQAIFDEIPEMRGHAHSTLKEYIASMGGDYGKRLGMKILADMTDHNDISTAIANMHWQVRKVVGGSCFLTSDRPVRREYPLRSKSSFLTLPIGPKAIFIAANSKDSIDRVYRQGEARIRAKQQPTACSSGTAICFRIR
jgi:hypothetical protein